MIRSAIRLPGSKRILLATLAATVVSLSDGSIVQLTSSASSTVDPRRVNAEALRVTPRTVVSVRGKIEGFGQDGDWIVWANVGVDSDAPCHRQVVIRRFSGGPITSLLSKGGPTCRAGWPGESGFYQGRMALAGTRALWANANLSTGGHTGYMVMSSSLRGGTERERDSFSADREEHGPFRPLPLAGDAATLLYADWNQDTTADRFGQVVKVESQLRRIPGAFGTFGLALSGRFLARGFVDYARNRKGVEVRNLRTGAVLARFLLTGVPREVGISKSRIAVLVHEDDGKRRIEIRRNATLERSVPVGDTAESLSMSGRWVVYRTGRVIRALDVRSGQAHRLAVAPSPRNIYNHVTEYPAGLSIEGRRVAWAERTSETRSRIRALTLPR